MPRSVVRGFSGARLRQRRRERGLTTDDLGDIAGVSAQVVSAWETGRYLPTPALLDRVAAALYVSIADLVVLPRDKMLLADLRGQAGLTQSGTARALGVSPSTLGRIEKGRKDLDRGTVAKLSELYGLDERQVHAAWERTVATRATRLQGM